MTVLDTSAAFDYLLGVGVSGEVQSLIGDEGALAAPDVLVFEMLAALRRHTLAGDLSARRALGVIEDLADAPIEIFPSMPLGRRAFELRRFLSPGDALFVALAEELEEPLATKDAAMARAVAKHCSAPVLTLRGD